MPPHLEARWACFVLINAEKVTWTECEQTLSIDDVADLFEALELMETMRAEVREIQRHSEDNAGLPQSLDA